MMTNSGLGFEEVEHGNTIISEFIGLYKQDTMGGMRYLYNNKESTALFFHSSMEWLMPVLDKIERLGFDTAVSRLMVNQEVSYVCKIRKENDSKAEFIAHVISDYKITTIWKAVIQFCSKYEHKPEPITKLKTK